MSEKVDYHPTTMEAFIGNGLHVLEKGDKIPKVLWETCAGVLLISAEEAGLVFTSQGGAGVAMAHKDGKWSAPIAVTLSSVGWGAGVGVAKMDLLIMLNHFAVQKLIEGKFQAALGADIGLTMGSIGGVAGGEISVSDKGGFGTSISYIWSKGLMVNVEVQTGAVMPDNNANYRFYNSSDTSDILEGKVKVPDSAEVTQLWEKLAQLES
jgi:lipid-binding SYLF domain-containing protein